MTFRNRLAVLASFLMCPVACVEEPAPEVQVDMNQSEVSLTTMKSRLDVLISQDENNEDYQILKTVFDSFTELPAIDSAIAVPTVNLRGGGGRCTGMTEVYSKGGGWWEIVHSVCCGDSPCTIDDVHSVCLSSLCED